MGEGGETFIGPEWVMETSMAAETREKDSSCDGLSSTGLKSIFFQHNWIFQLIPSGRKDGACRQSSQINFPHCY